MIRINLLAADRDKKKKKAVTLQAGQKMTIGCVGYDNQRPAQGH